MHFYGEIITVIYCEAVLTHETDRGISAGIKNLSNWILSLLMSLNTSCSLESFCLLRMQYYNSFVSILYQCDFTEILNKLEKIMCLTFLRDRFFLKNA